MNYEEKYKEALEKAQEELQFCDTLDCDAVRQIFRFFPELKESNNEKIRKELIRYLPYCDDISKDIKERWIAWLEKQHEPKPSWSEEDEKKRTLLINILEVNHHNEYFKVDSENTSNIDAICTEELVSWLKSIKCKDTIKCDKTFFKNQKTIGESLNISTTEECEKYHKAIDSCLDNNVVDNNTEPKFNGGDWIVDNRCGEVKQVIFLEDDGYELQSGGWVSYEDANKNFHLWTIEDAKDGDVLAVTIDDYPKDFIYIFKSCNNTHSYGFESHCYVTADKHCFSRGTWHNTANYGTPATKEQRDILFQKMKEAGYEWDGKKKELKKIEQRSIDNLEPKFRNGQWIVWQDRCYKVNYNGCGYELIDQNGLSTSTDYEDIDKNAHIWDITKDAKDGDVLAVDGRPFIYNGSKNAVTVGAYCGFNEEHRFSCTYNYVINRNITPTTKERCDLLFQKISEAGYTWDAKKKQLIKKYVI